MVLTVFFAASMTHIVNYKEQWTTKISYCYSSSRPQDITTLQFAHENRWWPEGRPELQSTFLVLLIRSHPMFKVLLVLTSEPNFSCLSALTMHFHRNDECIIELINMVVFITMKYRVGHEKVARLPFARVLVIFSLWHLWYSLWR
jgi:hypothetical protein